MHAMMSKRSLALAALLVAALAGCSSKAKDQKVNGSARVSVSGQALQADVITMALTIGPGTGSSFTAFTVPMSKTNNGEWTGYASAVPAGTGRTFHVEGKNALNTTIYAGDATSNINGGSTALVYMMLQEVTPPNQFGNHAPVIDSLTATSGTVSPGGSVSLSVTAHDPDTATDPANKISGYLWTATCGTLTGAATTTPTWTAPAATGSCTISVTVSDVCPSSQPAICASSVTASMVVQVVTPTTGGAQVSAYPNTCPVITCVSSVQNFSYDAQGKVNGYEANLTISAADAEGDDLHYVWASVGCPGAEFSNTAANGGAFFPPGASAQFPHNPTSALSNAPTTVHLKSNTVNACDIRVDVADFWPNGPPAGSGLPAARGCTNIGHLYLGGAVDFHYPPVIANLIQPNAGNQVNPGQPYTFGAAAVSDPQNAYPVKIDWYNDGASGAFGAQIPTAPYELAAAGLATMNWTAPSPLASGMKIRMRATNTFGLFTEQVFNIVPANACALAANGTPCDDGNACTQTDTCQAGACVGSNPVQCTPASSCQTSTCNTGTGLCVAGNVAANTPCNDASVCTANDVCNGSGACTGTAVPPPVAPVCRVVSATCDPVAGWTLSNAAAGTTCNDNSVCTTNDQCNASGVCTGTPVPAPTAPACKVVSATCDVLNGWTFTNATNGTPCSDGFACTGAPGALVPDQCTAGLCVGGSPTACSGASVCTEPGGTCQAPAAPAALALVEEGAAIGLSLGLAYDEQGFVYQAGNMFQPGYDFGCGLVNSAGSSDAFVVKLSPATGRCVPGTGWSKDFGDATNDQTVTSLGVNLTNAAFAGQFMGLLDLGAGVSVNNGGATIDYVAAVNRGSGAGAWVKSFDLNEAVTPPVNFGKINAIAGGLVSGGGVTSGGHFAVCGYVANKIAPATIVNNSTDATGTGLDAFVAVLDGANGNLIWGRQFGGAGDQTCNAVAFDDAGNVVIAGVHAGTMNITGVTPPLTQPTGSNRWGFVAKFNGDTGAVLGAANWATTGTSRVTPRAIATAADGSIVVSGQFQGSVTIGTTTLTGTGTSLDTFTAKVGSALAPVWAQRFGGAGADDARGLGVDSFGQVYVTAVFDGSPTNTWGTPTLTTAGSTDVVYARLDGATGNASAVIQAGDQFGQEPLAMVVARLATGGNQNATWLKGNYVNSISFPATPAPLSLSSGSTVEVRKFLVKLK